MVKSARPNWGRKPETFNNEQQQVVEVKGIGESIPDKNRKNRTLPERKKMGRPRGAKSKPIVKIKEMVEQALSELGGVDYLVEQGRKNPAQFLTLLAKVIPHQVQTDINAQIAIVARPQLSREEWLTAHGLGATERPTNVGIARRLVP